MLLLIGRTKYDENSKLRYGGIIAYDEYHNVESIVLVYLIFTSYNLTFWVSYFELGVVEVTAEARLKHVLFFACASLSNIHFCI